MQGLSHPSTEIDALEATAMQAAQSGREADAVRHWNRILELDPNHLRALNALGQRAFRQGAMPAARAAFQRIVDADGTIAQQWVQLAVACRNLNDDIAEEQAIQNALRINPRELVALILRGNLLERRARCTRRASAHGAVAAVAPSIELLPPELRPAVAEAVAHLEKYNRDKGRFLDSYLDQHYQKFAGEDLRRFRDVGRHHGRAQEALRLPVDVVSLSATRRRSSSSTAASFPWLDSLEAATDEIRDEFLGVLRTEEGFTPYISYPEGVPHNQFAELNNSPRWSAFHLFKSGQRVEANAARCPKTMAALAPMPQPDQPGRTPSAMFSLLKPKTTIPAHVGVSNVRLVTHLALIVPEGCSLPRRQ